MKLVLVPVWFTRYNTTGLLISATRSSSTPTTLVLMIDINISLQDIRIVYEILHDFTLKLQLDILFCQAQHLSKTISERYVAVEVYDSTAGLLAILYWLPDTPGSDGSYRITVERDPNRPCGGLVLRHHPFNSMLPTLSSGYKLSWFL